MSISCFVELCALKILKEVGAIRTDGHFSFSSGTHGSVRIDMDNLFENEKKALELCGEIAERFYKDNPDIVTGPADGGNKVAMYVASAMEQLQQRSVSVLNTVKSSNGKSPLIQDGDGRFLYGMKVLVVEDVLTTGATVRKLVGLVRSCGGEVVGVGALWNRGEVREEDLGGVPALYSVVNKPLESWDPPCPLCLLGIPLNR